MPNLLGLDASGLGSVMCMCSWNAYFDVEGLGETYHIQRINPYLPGHRYGSIQES